MIMMRLHLACREGNVEEVMALVEASPARVHEVDVLWDMTPLEWCVGDWPSTAEEIITFLLDNHANVDAAAFYTALHRAAVEGHVHIVELLLARGADPNGICEDGLTALAAAIEQVARRLLRHGAPALEYEHPVSFHHALHSQGHNPRPVADIPTDSALVYACALGRTEVVRLLLEMDIEPGKADGQGTEGGLWMPGKSTGGWRDELSRVCVFFHEGKRLS